MNYVLDKAGNSLIAKGLLPRSTVKYGLISDVGKPIKLVTESYLTDDEYAVFLAEMTLHSDPKGVMV